MTKLELDIEPWMGGGIKICQEPSIITLLGNAPLVPKQEKRSYCFLSVSEVGHMIRPTFQGVIKKAQTHKMQPVGLYDIGPLWHFLSSEDETARAILDLMKEASGMLLLGTEPQEDKKGFLTVPRLFLDSEGLMVYPWCCGKNSNDEKPSKEGKVSLSDLFVFTN